MTSKHDDVNGLPETPVLKPGRHMERLEAELLASYRTGRPRALRWMRAAAMVSVGAVLMGAGAVAKDVYDRYRHTTVSSEEQITYLDAQGKPGNKENASTVLSSSTPFNGTTETAARQSMKATMDAVNAKKYRLVREEDTPDGRHRYYYMLTLADGTEVPASGTVRLEETNGWDEWQKKQHELAVQESQQFQQAIGEGKARIVADDLYVKYVCKDAASGRTVEVMKFAGADGKAVAMISEPGADMSQHTSWQEHLDALSEGRRVLVQVVATPGFTYEYQNAEGKTVRHSCGGMPQVRTSK